MNATDRIRHLKNAFWDAPLAGPFSDLRKHQGMPEDDVVSSGYNVDQADADEDVDDEETP